VSGRAGPARVALSVAAVLALAAAAFGQIPQAALDLLVVTLTAAAMAAILRHIGWSVRATLAALVSAAAGLWLLHHFFPELQIAPYLAIAAPNVMVGALFHRSLQGERTPLILQFIDVTGLGGHGDDAFQRFVRRQCLAWAWLSFAVGAVASAAMVSSSLRGVAGVVTGALIAAQALLFVLSHVYASRRFKRRETWLVTLRVLANPSTWAALKL